jgi:betaine-aldehyde dehydrogenase
MTIVGADTVATESTAAIGTTVAELRGAQPDWAALGAAARGQWLHRYADWLLANDNRVVDALRADTGKPAAEAVVELNTTIDMVRYYSRNAARFLADRRPRPHNVLTFGKRITVAHHPYPVVGVITPWNFPFALAVFDSTPALLAGAAVVLKPSEFTPLTGQIATQGWAEIGAPPVWQCVPGDGRTGASVVDEVDFVQFTGSTRTGRLIGARCGERLIPYGLELGGKDAAIVLADADLDLAAKGIAWGGLLNAGQMCTSVERIYVEASVHDEFVDRLVEQVSSVRRGADISPLVTAPQAAIVREHLADAQRRGASVATGGGTDDRYVQPTVLTGLDPASVVLREETFGPVLPVVRVADADEAVRLANDTRYGLSATVWTRDVRRGEQVARRLEAGAVNVNDVQINLYCFPAPQAGWKESGIGGRLGGAAGILKYCRPQTITAPRMPVNPAPLLAWYPYTAAKQAITARFMRLLNARGLRRRLLR